MDCTGIIHLHREPRILHGRGKVIHRILPLCGKGQSRHTAFRSSKRRQLRQVMLDAFRQFLQYMLFFHSIHFLSVSLTH